MLKIFLIGIGTGNPEHLTLEGVRTIKKMDLILLPRKNNEKKELFYIREHICKSIIKEKKTVIKEYNVPERSSNLNYKKSVSSWHQKISENIRKVIQETRKDNNYKLGFLIWGDPGLYDSTLRIISKIKIKHKFKIISGISSIQSLTSAHSISLNEIGESVLITTGRKLKKKMFDNNQNVIVFLDAKKSFRILNPLKYYIWWGAYLGMKKQILVKGRLNDVYKEIISQRKKAKNINGWIMDTYLLKKIK